jgi:hypothetical protein
MSTILSDENSETMTIPPERDFYQATSTRLGISLKLQKAVIQYYMGQAEHIRRLQMFDDGVSNYIEIGSGLVTSDRKMRIYVLEARTYAELEKNALAAAGPDTNNENGDACMIVEQKNEWTPVDANSVEYEYINKVHPTSKDPNGNVFPTPCFLFNYHKLHWDKKVGKAYMIPLGNDGPYFDDTRRDGYMLSSIHLFQ